MQGVCVNNNDPHLTLDRLPVILFVPFSESSEAVGVIATSGSYCITHENQS